MEKWVNFYFKGNHWQSKSLLSSKHWIVHNYNFHSYFLVIIAQVNNIRFFYLHPLTMSTFLSVFLEGKFYSIVSIIFLTNNWRYFFNQPHAWAMPDNLFQIRFSQSEMLLVVDTLSGSYFNVESLYFLTVHSSLLQVSETKNWRNERGTYKESLNYGTMFDWLQNQVLCRLFNLARK